MTSNHHLAPSELDGWVAAASSELEVVVEAGTTSIILDLARDIAHDVARPAAPVSAYLLGLAVGRAGADSLGELSERLVRLAAAHRAAAEDR